MMNSFVGRNLLQYLIFLLVILSILSHLGAVMAENCKVPWASSTDSTCWDKSAPYGQVIHIVKFINALYELCTAKV